MTDPRDKQRQRDRYMKQRGKHRTREEEQQLQAARRARASGRSKPARADEDDVDFEKIRRPEPALGHAPPRVLFEANSAQLAGTVVWLGRGRARVRCGDEERPAVLAPELAQRQQTAVAVGDEVTLHERDGIEPLLVAVAERRSELVRTDPHNEHRRRVLAANVDVVVLVLTADRPRTGLIERLLLALQGSGAELCVCINKLDLAHDRCAIEQALRPHRQQGLPIAIVSATRGDGMDELEAIVRGRAVALVGHSGVGKSTLLNRLDPDRERAVGAVRDHDGKGRHTTTAASLSVLADGTRLIDTPGVRAFGLVDGATDAVAAFEDIAALADGCRFRDCAHLHEPGCAVRAAVDQGELERARYESFLRLAK